MSKMGIMQHLFHNWMAIYSSYSGIGHPKVESNTITNNGGNKQKVILDWDVQNQNYSRLQHNFRNLFQIGIRLTFGWIERPSKTGISTLGWESDYRNSGFGLIP
jgi:hypothetical protein